MEQKKKFGRKILSALFTLAMVIGLMPWMSLTVKAECYPTVSGNTSNITYSDDGTQVTSVVSNFSYVDSGDFASNPRTRYYNMIFTTNQEKTTISTAWRGGKSWSDIASEIGNDSIYNNSNTGSSNVQYKKVTNAQAKELTNAAVVYDTGYNTQVTGTYTISDSSVLGQFQDGKTYYGLLCSAVTGGVWYTGTYVKVVYNKTGFVASITDNVTTTKYGNLSAALSAWTDGSTLTLLADVETANTISVSGTKILDLNGYGIKMTGTGRVLNVENGASLTLNDGNPSAVHKYTIADPKSNGAGLAVVDDDNGNTEFTGGYITGGNESIYNGGGVLVDGGSLTMTGGTVIGNKTTDNAAHGGGIAVISTGTFKMSGGAIIGNAAPYGGGLSFMGTSTATIEGGEIKYNYTTRNGGGIHTDQNPTLTITGGKIINNYTDGEGGIEGRHGGGLMVGNTDNKGLNLSGNPTIEGNQKGEASENIYLYSENKINITGILNNDMSIGVTLNNNTAGVFTNSTTTDYNDETKFTSDNSDYSVIKNSDGQLSLVPNFKVTFDSQGGSEVESKNVINGSKVTKPENPTKEGYKFGGWYKEAECTNAWDFDSDTVTTATTLYAKWTEKPYEIGSIEEWNEFVENVNAGETYAGRRVVLTADIGPVTEKIKVGKTFNGTFDGGGHLLTVDFTYGSNERGAALFPYLASGDITVKNLKLAGVIRGGIHAAGIFGEVEAKSSGSNITIDNVMVCTTVIGGSHLGGIVGHAGSSGNTCTVTNSQFLGTIKATTGSASFIGGLIGWGENTKWKISDCKFGGRYGNTTYFNAVGYYYQTQNGKTVTDITSVAGNKGSGDQHGRPLYSGDYTSYDTSIKSNLSEYNGKYDDEKHGINVSVTEPESNSILFYGESDDYCLSNPSPTLTDVGEKKVYYHIYAWDYPSVFGSGNITITKGDAVVTTAPTAKELIYSGKGQELVTAGAAKGGEIQYALGTDATTVPTTGWDASIPTGIDTGTYYVWYKVVGDSNHEDYIASSPVTVIIEQGATVTYDVNGATGGSVPADSKSPYKIDDKVTVLGNTDSLIRDGYTFDGWNTKADGSGTAYAVGAVFTIKEDTTLYAQWMKDYSYLDAVWNAEMKKVDYPKKSIGADKVTVVNETTTKWNSGWYAVTENVTISGRVTVNGDVKLILCNGKTLTATNGISVDSGKKFTVYGQTNDTNLMGILNSRTQTTTGVASAGIGGSGKGKTSGVITINGGKVTASGSREAGGAGIGGGFNASGGTTVINGGVVTVPVRKSVAGIGGGREGSGGNITINGGTVNAGGYAGAAIGGAHHGSAGNITINGGTVIATDGTKGAAIGSGEKKNSSTNAGTIRINGGKVIARNTAGSGSGGAAIGGGYNVPGGTIIITGGEVTATSVYGAGIGGGPGANGGKVTISGGTVTAYCSSGGAGIGRGNGGKNHGTLTVADDHVCRAGDSESTAGACFNYQSHRKKWVKIWQHIHSEITYGIEGNVLTATCTNDVDNCNLVDGKLTLTLTAPNKLYDAKVYDKAKTAWTSVNHNEWEEFSILTGTTSKSGGSIEYYQGETKLGGAPTEEGTYIAKLPVVLNSQNEYLEQEFMIIKPEAIFVTVPETKELTYNDTEQELITAGVGRDGTIKYSLDDQNYGDDIPVATNAGNYTVWVYVEGDDLHNDSPKVSFDVTIKKKPAPTLTDGQKPTANTAVPEVDDPDKETPLLNPPTEAAPDGYKIVYAIGKDGTNVPETEWSEDIPEGKDGTYYIWFKAVKDDNHEETKPENIKVDRIDYSVALSPSTPTVGEPVTVTVTPKNDSVIYEWYAGTDPDNYTLIEGETGNTYTPTDADKGKTLKVVAKLDDKVIGEDNTASPISETAAEEDKEIIAGDVYGSDGTTKAAGAKIILKRGNTVVAETETDADGKYSFSVEAGIYNVVSKYNGVTKTELVEITTSQDFDLAMPEKNTNSVLVVGDDLPDIMVGGLDVEAETVRAAETGAPDTVTVTMTLNKKEESAETSEDVNAIREKAADKTLEFFETKIVKTVDGTTDSDVTETANVLTIVVPYELTGRDKVTVYRSNGDITEELSDKTPGIDGTFQIDNDAKTITIYTSRPATYAIGYNAINKESVETFNAEKEKLISAADDLINEDEDSDESKELVEAAKKAIDELTYDHDKTLDKNKEALDAIITKLEKDLEKQRVLEKLTDTPADVKVDQGEPVINVDTENIPEEYVETVEEIAKNTTVDIEDAVIKQAQEIVNRYDDVADSDKNIVIIPSLKIDAKDYDLSEDDAKLTLDIEAVYKSYETTDDITSAADTMSAAASDDEKVREIGSGNVDTKGTPVDIRIELPEDFAQAIGATTENTIDSPETAFVKHTNNGINYEYDVKLYYDDDVYVAEFVDPNGLGTFTLSGSSESVVSTDGNNYTDLQSAIDDTEDGAVIKLIKDSDILAVIDTEKTITIDKADHTGTVDITVPPTLLLIKTDNEDGTVTYKAVAKYTVTFDANGGTGTMVAQEIGGTAALNANTFTREGFTFDGWNTKADGKGTAYADKAEVAPAADMTLYAQWKENPKTDDKKTDEAAKNTADIPAAAITVAQKNELSINAGFKVTQKGSKITVKWGKVNGATGYEVYVAYCGKNFSKTPAKRTTTKASAVVTKIGGKKINLKKNFKVYVVAVKKDGSKTSQLAKTITGHIVGRKNTKYTNVKSITLTTKTISIAVGKASKIKAKTVLVNKKKKQLSDAHAAQFRYASSDESIATVDKNGNVKGVSAGTTTVYVYARNGYAKTVSVTVK